MTDSEQYNPTKDAKITLSTFGETALYVSAPDSVPARVLDLGKPLAVVTYLACVESREATREHLVELFWEGTERDRAKNALRQTIWQIKDRVGDGILTATRDRVSLADSVETDRDRFLAAWRSEDVDLVVNLYAGDFVTGLALRGGTKFQRWADAERSSLRAVFLGAAEIVVKQRLASGHAREALALARRSRDLDRLNQRAWRQFLECLIAAGDSAIATVEADKFGQLLTAEGIELEAATRAAIREAQATLSGATANADGSAGGLDVELIGREDEFTAVLRGWDDATRGRQRRFHIVASAGLGKTRFLTDLQNRLRAAGGRTVYARADFSARDIAYSLAAEVALHLAALPGAEGISPESQGSLVALNPSLSSLFSVERDGAIGDEAARRRTFALRELIVAVSTEPLALLVDDLHWSDPSSFRTLDAALGGLEKNRILVVTAGRPTEDERRPAGAKRITLEPLDADAIVALMSNVATLPDEQWSRRLAYAIRDATDGSPLQILETLKLLIEQSLLVRAQGIWVVDDSDALFEALAMGSALQRRVESLDPVEGSVLLLLALAGTSVDRTVIAEATARTVDETAAAIAVLEQRGLALREGDDTVSVAHAEHGAAAIDFASAASLERAAGAFGHALLSRAGNDVQRLFAAGSLIARAGDDQRLRLSKAFERFVRARRRAGDRSSDRMLARELLGPAAPAHREDFLVRSLPWLVRLRLVTPARIAATIAIVGICLFAGIRLWASWSPAPPPDAVLVALRTSADRASVEGFRVPIDASRWAGISILDVRLSRRPQWRMKAVAGDGGRTTRPDHQGWTEGVIVPDSGVIDIFDLGLHETARQLTFARGDDYEPNWAPDNSRFVFITSRWSRHGHYDLAVYDTVSRGVRQLTAGDDTDWDPAWSPDGSRIAFIRQYADGGDRGLCVIDVDGGNLHCFPPEQRAFISMAGWADAHRVLLRRIVGDTHQLTRFNLESGAPDLVDDRGSDAQISPDGRFALCQCPRQGYPTGTFIVYPLERPNEFATIHVVGGDTAGLSFEWAPMTHRSAFVTNLRVLQGVGPPLLGASYQLRALSVDSANRPVESGVVRWRSEDTTIATVDMSGRLVPLRAGRVTIRASAGGWRDTSASIDVAAPTGTMLLDEDWSTPMERTWRPFGEPTPLLTEDATLGHAFLNNGDGIFFSGVYTRQAFPTRDGLWVEAELSTRITASESQEQVFSLFHIVDSVAWARWDHRTGDGPRGVSSPNWSIRYPQGIGGKHLGEQLAVSTRLGTDLVNVPADIRSGHVFKLLMQIFPDGRCGVALNGSRIWVGRADFLEPSVRLMLAGNSVDTRILVGHLRIGTGIAGNIVWD